MWNHRRNDLTSANKLLQLKFIFLVSIAICPERQQFVRIYGFVYFKSLSKQWNKKEELPKQQAQLNTTCHIDLLKKEILLFAITDSQVNKNLCFLVFPYQCL